MLDPKSAPPSQNNRRAYFVLSDHAWIHYWVQPGSEDRSIGLENESIGHLNTGDCIRQRKGDQPGEGHSRGPFRHGSDSKESSQNSCRRQAGLETHSGMSILGGCLLISNLRSA